MSKINKKKKMEVDFASLKFKNPILVASGTFGYGKEYSEIFNINQLGGLITKTITLLPKTGNPSPRIAETHFGILNSVGLQNEGLKSFIKNTIPNLKKINTNIIVSIGGNQADEFSKIVESLDKYSCIDAFELNLSCPNVMYELADELETRGKNLISQDVFLTFEIVRAVRKITKKPIIPKLSPNVTDIISIARSCYDAGADGLTLANTYAAMGINLENKKPLLGGITGGLSGPAIKPLTLKLVWEVFQEIDLPIIGSGGVINYKDVLEYIIVGAALVSIGTATFVEPKSSLKMIKEIENYLTQHNIDSIQNLIGTVDLA